MLYSNNLKSNPTCIYQQSQNSSSSEVDEDQSSCSQCKRNAYGISQQQQEESSQLPQRRHNHNYSSQESHQQIQKPMQKHINSKNYEFQKMLHLLQFQVETLKKQNQTKDEIIKELKFHLHKNFIEEQRQKETDKQTYEINRLRQQLGCSPRSQSYNYENKRFTHQSFNKFHQNRGLNTNKISHQNKYQNPNNMLNSFNPRLCTKNYDQGSNFILQNNDQIPTDYQLKIVLLQKQIRQYQLQTIQQKQIITKLQQENKWQSKFICSFIKMCDQLSLNYGEKIHFNKRQNDLKKKTKISWNYMKNLISYFIQVINTNTLKKHYQR